MSPAVRQAPVRRAVSATVSKKGRMSGENRRRQLLRVAIDTFARDGFGGTKTRDIASAAGVSEAILFRHFATKEDLYHAILDAKEDTLESGRMMRSLELCARRRDDAGLFRQLAANILSSFRDAPAFHRLMVYASLEVHLLASLFRERFGLPMSAFLHRYVTLRQKEGAFRECEPDLAVMFAVGTVVHFAMGRYVFRMTKVQRGDDAVVEKLVTLVLGGLTRPGGSCPRKPSNRKGTDAQS
jgi:AcrR family transcriptional regulator